MSDSRPFADGTPPQPRVSLEQLYAVVPIAEEIDLREELERERSDRLVRAFEERRAAELGDLLRVEFAGQGESAVEDDESTGTPDDQLSSGQVLGLLEHRLGARVVDREEGGVDDSSETNGVPAAGE